MSIQALIEFFMWCTIMNGSLLVLWTSALMLAPGFLYRMQSQWFPIPRETYDVVMFSFLGLFKIFFLIFNLVPYVALLIVRHTL